MKHITRRGASWPTPIEYQYADSGSSKLAAGSAPIRIYLSSNSELCLFELRLI